MEDVKKVQQWLDNLISAAAVVRNISLGSCKFENGCLETIEFFSQGVTNKFAIHVYSGLQKTAELLGLEVTAVELVFQDGKRETEYSVNYKGCTLYQLGGDKN